MHDEVPVREGDGVADLAEESDAVGDRQPRRSRVFVDVRAVHELHHEVGEPVRRRAAVEESRDVRVREAREDLALGAEAGEDELAVHAAADELDRDAAFVLGIGPRREVNRAHAAAPDLPLERVRPEPARFAVGVERQDLSRERSREEAVRLVRGGQERADLVLELQVSRARRGQERLAARRVHPLRLLEQVARAPEALGGLGGAQSPAISRWSHASACFQSRLTVA